MKPTIISILGRPLAGKDTQAALLARKLPDAVILSTGAMIREVKDTGPTHRFWPILGPEIEVMDKGILISEDAINRVFEQVVHERLMEGRKYIIATAHPRTERELDSFDKMLVREGLEPVFINLNTSVEHMRQLHKTRNHDRADDAAEVVATRIAEYDNRTKPVMDRLRQEGRLVDIDGEQGREAVHRDIMDAVRPYLADPEITLPPMARR